jgi:exonuclease SbcD
MFKIVFFTDIHLADVGPLSRKDNYRDSILNKLEQIRIFCVENKVDLALCGGDIFHIKTPTKNSHYLVSQTVALFKSFPCPIYSLYGNHDIRQDNLSTLDKQPFYTLLKSKACVLLQDDFFDNGKIRVFGIDYLNDPEYADFNRSNKGEKLQICIAHVNASSKFDDLFGERVYKYQSLSQCTPQIFAFGHYHPDQGIEEHAGKSFINIGSISRGSLKKDELQRIPSFGYIEIAQDYSFTCQKKNLIVLASNEIFDLELK